MESCLIFTIDQQLFALDLLSVKSVIPAAAVTSMPHSHPDFIGLVKVGKAHIPVLNMRAHLEIAHKDLEISDQFIICIHEGYMLALWVDTVTEVYKCHDKTFSKVPSHLQKDNLFLSLFNHKEKIILVLNPAHLFSLSHTPSPTPTGPQ